MEISVNEGTIERESAMMNVTKNHFLQRQKTPSIITGRLFVGIVKYLIGSVIELEKANNDMSLT